MAKQTLTIEVGAKNNVGGVFANIQRDVQRLKNSVGESSGVGGLLAITRGAGAAAGVVAGVRTATSLVEAFVEVRDAINEGGDAFMALENVMKRTPLINIIQGFGAAVNEAFTGNQATIRRLSQESQAANAGVDFGNSLMARMGARKENAAVARGELDPTMLQASRYAESQRKAFKVLREELKMTTQQAAQLSKILEMDIQSEWSKIFGDQAIGRARTGIKSLLEGVGRFITPGAIRGFQDAQKPTIFGIRNPFEGSEADKRRQVEEQARRQDAIRTLRPRLQQQLDALRGERLSTLDTLRSGVSTGASLGVSGVRSSGMESLTSASSQERALAAAIKKLNEEQSKRDQKSQESLDSIIEELRRGFNIDIPKELRRI